MVRTLVTGMSGAGKSTLLIELARRGRLTIDTDYDGWTLRSGLWDEARVATLLASQDDVIVSGDSREPRGSSTPRSITSSCSPLPPKCS